MARLIEPDIVIAATGYRTGLEPMVGKLGVLDGKGVPLFNGGDSDPKLPGLWFTGMRPSIRGCFANAGIQAKAIARRIPVPESQPVNLADSSAGGIGGGSGFLTSGRFRLQPAETDGFHQHLLVDHAGIVQGEQGQGDFARLGRIGVRFALAGRLRQRRAAAWRCRQA